MATKEKLVRVRLKAGRKFSLVTGEDDNRIVTKVDPGSVIEVTEAQARNFADQFEDPNLAPAGETLTAEEQEALAKFRADKKKEAEEAAAKAKSTPTSNTATAQAQDTATKTAEDKPKK